MEQRRVRLGDIVDDYCPRERRVTNHAVVAMIDDEVKQTRCVTCDAEHVYKAAKVPARRKKKEAPGALYEQVLSGMPDAPDQAAAAGPALAGAPAPIEEPPRPSFNGASAEPPAPALEAEPSVAPPSALEEGPVRRPLIRATLPRPEGQAPARPAPEFTVRHVIGRDGDSRKGSRAQRSPGNGGRPAGSPGPNRFAAGRAARGMGNRPGPFSQAPGSRPSDRSPSHAARPARQGQPSRYGKKRSR